MYTLRPYQKDSVDAVINYFKKHSTPGVIVLPTGAGKSLVIAELARISKGRVLVLAHVKELVEQNHNKYESYGVRAGIYSAGLSRKDNEAKVIFGSIQSVARASDDFFSDFSLLIIDECHRVSLEKESQYQQVITKLKSNNNDLKTLGLTATPYRLGIGWIYKFHYRGIIRTEQERFFRDCIYELPLSFMIRNKYLTPPIVIDSPVACYDFSTITPKGENESFSLSDLEEVLKEQKRVTPGIVQNITEQARERSGVMIFTSTINHAREILSLLPQSEAKLIIGDTHSSDRDLIILEFKERKIKYLVNVSVLTTGFDAPHVDLIALLRPTESISLYQQIIGRGLRLSPGKEDCLILDYTGVGHNLFSPEVGEKKPSEETEQVEVLCPACGHENIFWGMKSEEGFLIEHYGRKCQGGSEDSETLEFIACGFRYRLKHCPDCGAENDIAARCCNQCSGIIVDPDKKLREAMQLKDAHVMRTDSMIFEKSQDKKGREKLEISYYDADGEQLLESFYFDNDGQKKAFFHNFVRPHLKNPGPRFDVDSIEQVILCQKLFRMPSFVIARKEKYYWAIREKIFI